MRQTTHRHGLFASRRRVLTLALAVLMFALLAGGTLAYFTDEETAYNVITTGNLDMTLHEDMADGKPFPKDGYIGAMPGESVDKKVYISNDGSVGMYVRIAVQTSISPDTLSLDCVSIDWNTTDWTEQGGYYYYNSELKPGDNTAPLFTKVSFDAHMPNEYQSCKVNVTVKAQSVQSRNNGDSALTAAGWSE